MSYGQNLPNGLQATKTITGAPFTGQVNTYLIKSGYGNNIFRNDPVVIGGGAGGSDATQQGYVISLYDYNASVAHTSGTNFRLGASLGVFDGCSFTTPTSVNPIDPASPGRSFWPAGTVTLGTMPAIANIIDDPNVVFNIQTNGVTGIQQANMGCTAPVVFTLTTGIVQGNTNTGESTVALDQSNLVTNGASTNYNLKLLRFVADPRNIPATATVNSPYNNVEVIINNHFYASRPPAAQ